MLENRLGNSGAISSTTEQVAVTVPPSLSGDEPIVTFDVLSPIKPGAAVYISFDEASASGGPSPYFLVLQAAVTAIGQVTVTFYVIVEFDSPLTVQAHVNIQAHDLEQCG